MDFTFTEEQIEWQNRAKQFAEQEIAPYLEILESDQNKIPLYQKMARAGFFTMALDEEFHGSQTSSLAYLLALKEISKIDAGVGVTMAVTAMVAETIARFGKQEFAKDVLLKVRSGQNVPLSFALTEEKVGSDAKKIETTAVLGPNHQYMLKGEKWFITNADLSPFTIVLAKTGERETTAFLVPRDAPGFEIIYKERKLGLLIANLVRIRLNQVLLAPEYRLGAPGEGFKIMMNSLNSGRLGIAAQAIGIGEAAYEASLEYSQKRLQFDVALSQHQEISYKLADMRLNLDAAQLLLYKASWLKDQQKPFHLEASEAKLYASEMCLKIVDQAVQIFGARGYVKDYPLERYYRDAKATTLYEGTSEIQRLVIAKEILKKIF